MKKNIIHLTESELYGLIQESVKKILSEGRGYYTESLYIDLNNVDITDERLLDFLENVDEYPEIEVTFKYTINPYNPGDYYNPPEGGDAEIDDWEYESDNMFKKALSPELYELLISFVDDYIEENRSYYANYLYELPSDYNPDYDD